MAEWGNHDIFLEKYFEEWTERGVVDFFHKGGTFGNEDFRINNGSGWHTLLHSANTDAAGINGQLMMFPRLLLTPYEDEYALSGGIGSPGGWAIRSVTEGGVTINPNASEETQPPRTWIDRYGEFRYIYEESIQNNIYRVPTSLYANTANVESANTEWQQSSNVASQYDEGGQAISTYGISKSYLGANNIFWTEDYANTGTSLDGLRKGNDVGYSLIARYNIAIADDPNNVKENEVIYAYRRVYQQYGTAGDGQSPHTTYLPYSVPTGKYLMVKVNQPKFLIKFFGSWEPKKRGQIKYE